MRPWLLALSLALLAAPAAPAAPAEGPVAVMPFRNLSGAKDLAWLEVGIAETLLADLKKKSRLPIVERAQVTRVLEELSFQADAQSEVLVATKVGRLVGARTLVIGSFQEAGGALRITARFIDVETGLVTGTAKATGPLRQVFALQDEIAAALSKRAPPKRKPARKSVPDKTLAAYRLFAQAMTSASDDERSRYLKEALQLDAGFAYASDALTRLEARLAAYAKQADARFSERERALRARIYDASAPKDERLAATKALLEALVATRRYHALLSESERVAGTPLPQSPLLDVKELASFARVLALSRLRRVDLALQAGERHLKAFPAGDRYREVETLVRELIEEKREALRLREEYEAELKELASERVALQTEGAFADPARLAHLDYRPCIAAKWSKLAAEMRENCGRFLKQHGRSKDPDTRDFVLDARAFVIWAHALEGDFEKARVLADALAKDAPGKLGEIGLQKIIDERWPTDAP